MYFSNVQAERLSLFGRTWVLQNVALLWQSVATTVEEKKSESSKQSSKYGQEQQMQQNSPWLKYLDESLIKNESLIEKEMCKSNFKQWTIDMQSRSIF